MKKFIKISCFFICFTLFFAACSSDSNQQSESATTKAATDEHAGHNHDGHDHSGHDHSGHDHSTHVASSHLSPYIGMWEIAAVIGISKEKELRETYTGKWFDFKGDNTFTSGKWQEQTSTGKWNVDKNSKNISLDFDGEVEKDIQWGTQGNSETMIWLANAGSNQTGAQMKLTRTTQRPKKN